MRGFCKWKIDRGLTLDTRLIFKFYLDNVTTQAMQNLGAGRRPIEGMWGLKLKMIRKKRKSYAEGNDTHGATVQSR